MAISLGDLAPILIPIGPLMFFILLFLKPALSNLLILAL
jgi:hypothetical protein